MKYGEEMTPRRMFLADLALRVCTAVVGCFFRSIRLFCKAQASFVRSVVGLFCVA